MKVVPITKKPPEPPGCAYLVAYQIEGGTLQVMGEGLDAYHILSIEAYLQQLKGYLVGDSNLLILE